MTRDTVHSTRTRLSMLAVLAAAAALPTSAHAQALIPALCLKRAPANIVPGLGGPPKWNAEALGDMPPAGDNGFIRNELNEPRWTAAPLTRFANDPLEQLVSEGGFRVVLSDDQRYLYVSVQNKADTVRSPNNHVTFGLQKVGGTARAITLPLYNSTTNALGGPVPRLHAAGDPLVHTYRGVSTSAAPDPAFPAAPAHHYWTTLGGTPDWVKHAASWTTQSVEAGGADWAIQFRVDLQAFDIYPPGPSKPQGDDFRFAVGMHTWKSRNGAEYLAEVGVPAQATIMVDYNYVNQGAIMGDPSTWRLHRLGTACSEGIKADSIAVTNSLTGAAAGKVDARAGQVNTFSVGLRREDTTPITQNTVQATFKIANWGADIGSSSAEWSTLRTQTIAVPGTMPVRNKLPLNTSTNDGFAGSTNLLINYPCPANTATEVCGAPKPTGDYQCIMTELAQAPGAASTVISSPVTFKNFRFEGLSEKQLDARLSIRGLAALTGRAVPRDVLIDVITRNMPVHGSLPIFLDSYFLNQLKSALVGLIQLLNPFGLSLSAMDQMKVAWPTYETHTYYEAGHTTKYKGKTYKIVRPMNGFGYFFSHEGLLFGYNHELRGMGQALTRTSTNGNNQSYFVRVPSEGRVNLKTYMIAEEIPSFLVNTSNRLCTVFDIPCYQ